MAKTIEEFSLADLMTLIEKTLNDHVEPIQGLTAIYQFDITSEETGIYQLHFQDGTAVVKSETEDEADCTMSMTLANFQQFLLGKLNGTMAFMTGKLKIKG